MSKNRKLLIKGGASTGLIVLTCFCCLFFRTRFLGFASVAPSPTPAPVALPAISDVAYDCSADIYNCVGSLSNADWPTSANFDSPGLTIRALELDLAQMPIVMLIEGTTQAAINTALAAGANSYIGSHSAHLPCGR